MSVIETELVRLKQAIDAPIDRHPALKRDPILLKSMKGNGDVMARELVYLFAVKHFKTAKQAAAYIGLMPKLKGSGKFKGRSTMSKTGPARLRAKLYLAAGVACQHNPDIKAQRERLLKAGKTKVQALGAAMRKLIQICFGVVKNQTEYQRAIP